MRHAILLTTLLIATPLDAQPVRAGTAAVIITPPAGAPMAGYYHNRAAAGVHDDLHAKALVIESAAGRAALIACDLISMPEEIAALARKLIQERTGIPAGNVMISATHAHTGPVLAAGRTRYNLQGTMRDLALKYASDLPALIASAAEKANAALAPARFRGGAGHEPTLTFNRRFHMKDGTVGWNPGKMNPNIVRAAGPIDPDVAVLSVETPEGKQVATYVNYALHLDTVGGEEYSADYPYTVGEILRKVRGNGHLTLFTIGAAGNLNHIDVSTREPQRGHGEAARIGTVLAAEVLKTLKKAEPLDASTLTVRREVVRLPLAPFKREEVEQARATAATFGERNAAPFLDLVRAARLLDTAEREGRPLDAEVQVIALGRDIAWVGLPGEIFTELGMAIKQASPFRQTVIVELANASLGYIPNRKAHAEGAYEAVSARCAAGSGEMLVDAAVRLLVSAYQATKPADR